VKIKPRIKLSNNANNSNKFIIENTHRDETITLSACYGNVTIRVNRIIDICDLNEGYDESGCKTSVLVSSNKKAKWINFKEPAWFIISLAGWG
jgi:hypothetical protein